MRASHAFFAVILVLALAGLGGLRYWRSPAPKALPRESDPARIEIRRPREDVVLVRRAEGDWRVLRQDDLADAAAVDQLLAGLRSLEFGPPVASSEIGAASGLGPADSTRVRVLDAGGRALFDGQFGRRLFGRSCYFRARDGDGVRVASGADPELLLRSNSQWREPRLLPQGCPDGVEVSANGERRLVAGEAAEKLCSLRASHWATGALEELAGFDAPLLRARTPDGRGFTVGERRGRERLVRVDGRAALLRIHAAYIEDAASDLIR